jgi:hypothetical protein
VVTIVGDHRKLSGVAPGLGCFVQLFGKSTRGGCFLLIDPIYRKTLFRPSQKNNPRPVAVLPLTAANFYRVRNQRSRMDDGNWPVAIGTSEQENSVFHGLQDWPPVREDRTLALVKQSVSIGQTGYLLAKIASTPMLRKSALEEDRCLMRRTDDFSSSFHNSL